MGLNLSTRCALAVTCVIGGMSAATVLAIFFIPVSFDVIEKFGHWIGLSEKPEPKPAEEAKGVHV